MIFLLGLPCCFAKSNELLFAARALEFREAGVAGSERFLAVVNAMPGSAIVEPELLPSLWAPSFANTIAKLGRLRSDAPVSLYYDPLLDIAVIAYWSRTDNGYSIRSVRTLTGERMSGVSGEVSLAPSWMSFVDGAVTALTRTTSERLAAFSRSNPAEEIEPGRDGVAFAAASADLRAVLPRLAWFAEQRGNWTGAYRGWLEPVLSKIEELLAGQDAGPLMSEAPDTDADTAVALASLPSGFADSLVLDMTLETGHDRLLIGSSPADGDTYVLASCTLRGDICWLRRLMQTSLLE